VPADAKPLFRPEAVRPHLAAFRLPDRVAALRPTLANWAGLIASGRVDALGEREILPDFLTDFFHGLLGYAGPAGGPGRYTFSREKHVQVDGKYADAVAGEFGPGRDPAYVLAVEGKGPRDPLDRPFAGRAMSAVDQGYRYAINLPCDWIVVTSVRQTRLYHKGSDQQTYERFDTERLAADDAALRRFVFLLGAERVVPPGGGRCHFYDLLKDSERIGKELTKAFYVHYADLRQDAFERLRAANPAVPAAGVLAATQKVLDRVLFASFCEDRGLLPADTVARAYEHADPYNPRPVWENFRGLFRSVNDGNPRLNIPRYNGGLFAPDPLLDALNVPDEVCAAFRDIAAYDYRPPQDVAAEDARPPAGRGRLVDVDILGHIFEQSITDLEKIRGSIAGGADAATPEQHKARRKREGAFYTPGFVTRYMVGQALGTVLGSLLDGLRARHEAAADGTAKAALARPAVYDFAALNRPQRAALVAFGEAWQEDLKGLRLLDPSCGSGAFLIEAFDQLHAAYQASNDRLADLRGHRTLFDLDRQILQHNLYGVDLNAEAVEICKLSLWIKTAQRGKELTSLDRTIRVGNSVVDDPAVDARAFDWRAALPEASAAGGFDVVLGNPPYVRQELIQPIKPHLAARFASYHGMADLYVYFYELALRLLKPGGRLSLIVTNKWLKAGYAEPLRRHLAERSWVESLVDFGHAKQIFEDADVFPCILVARKPVADVEPPPLRLAVIPREQLRVDDLSRQIADTGCEVERGRFRADAWQLESAAVTRLMQAVRSRGTPLAAFVGAKPLRGVFTGFNDAFVITTTARNALVDADPRASEVIRPFLRGQDVKRWAAEWDDLWLIAIRSSGDHAWPWSPAAGPEAERLFADAYLSLHAHLEPYEPQLVKRQDKGRFWWELRSWRYWSAFDQPERRPRPARPVRTFPREAGTPRARHGGGGARRGRA
jgi:hypothetical protein